MRQLEDVSLNAASVHLTNATRHVSKQAKSQQALSLLGSARNPMLGDIQLSLDSLNPTRSPHVEPTVLGETPFASSMTELSPIEDVSSPFFDLHNDILQFLSLDGHAFGSSQNDTTTNDTSSSIADLMTSSSSTSNTNSKSPSSSITLSSSTWFPNAAHSKVPLMFDTPYDHGQIPENQSIFSPSQTCSYTLGTKKSNTVPVSLTILPVSSSQPKRQRKLDKESTKPLKRKKPTSGKSIDEQNQVVGASPASDTSSEDSLAHTPSPSVPMNSETTSQPQLGKWNERELSILLSNLCTPFSKHLWTQTSKKDLCQRLSDMIGSRTASQVKNKLDYLQKTYRDVVRAVDDFLLTKSLPLTIRQVQSLCPHFEKLHSVFYDSIKNKEIQEEMNRIFRETYGREPAMTSQMKQAVQSSGSTTPNATTLLADDTPKTQVPYTPSHNNTTTPLFKAVNESGQSPGSPLQTNTQSSIHSKLLALQEQELRTKQVMAELEIVRLKTWSDAFKAQPQPSLPGSGHSPSSKPAFSSPNDYHINSHPLNMQWNMPSFAGAGGNLATAFDALLPPKSTDVISSIQRQEFKARRALMELDLFRINSVLLAMEPPRHLDNATADAWRSEVKHRYDSVKGELDRLRELLESSTE